MQFEGTFFNYIENWYGKETKNKMKEFMAKSKQIASQRSRKEFLLQCRRYKVSPKSLRINMKRYYHCINRNAAEQLSVNFSNQILNAAIKKQFTDIHHSTLALNKLSTTIYNMVPVDVYRNFKQHMSASYDKELMKRVKSQKKRFEKLIEPVTNRLSVTMT